MKGEWLGDLQQHKHFFLDCFSHSPYLLLLFFHQMAYLQTQWALGQCYCSLHTCEVAVIPQKNTYHLQDPHFFCLQTQFWFSFPSGPVNSSAFVLCKLVCLTNPSYFVPLIQLLQVSPIRQKANSASQWIPLLFLSQRPQSCHGTHSDKDKNGEIWLFLSEYTHCSVQKKCHICQHSFFILD